MPGGFVNKRYKSAGVDGVTPHGQGIAFRTDGTSRTGMFPSGFPSNNIGGDGVPVAGFRTNATIPVTYKFEAFKDEFTREVRQYMPIFVHSTTEAMTERNRTDELVTGVSLAALNMICHMRALRGENVVPHKVCDAWRLAGFMNTTMKDPGFGNGDTVKLVDAKGDLFIRGLWGQGVKPGDYIGFIVKMVPITSSTMYTWSMDGKFETLSNVVTHGTNKGRVLKRVVQVLPLASKSRIPTQQALSYGLNHSDGTTTIEYGEFILAGRVTANDHRVRTINPYEHTSDIKSLANNVMRQEALPQIEAFINIVKG
ncbi:MAG: hypothetical protein ACTSUE_17845 [Promethearchaeota archaeon]